MSKTQVDLSLTAGQLSSLIDAQEKREIEAAMQSLKVLATYDSSENMNETLKYHQSILVALAYNKPELLEGFSHIHNASDAIRYLDHASREMLSIWFSSRDRILRISGNGNKEVERK